ncbi:MAG: ABC transporter permease [Candidatus Symbiothrix sp.]|jgi:putative ABC transport system permease protein|nr:ABC transporter permease [Candidatus Symbiothrix sp.]
MNILNSYKRTRFFLWINITGLAIGLAASIMLILFVVNELSYDKHFPDSDRIIRLNTVLETNTGLRYHSESLGKAYSELPAKAPGIEAATHLAPEGKVELVYKTERFRDLNLLQTDSDFFKVFQMKFLAGTAEKALESPHSLVITIPYADIIFGGADQSMDKTVSIGNAEYTISAVVEKLLFNTHFSFDLWAANIPDYVELNGAMDFYVYYRISPDASLSEVRTSIEKEYTSMLEPLQSRFNAKSYGATEKLTAIYIHSKTNSGIGKSNNMKFIGLLLALSLFILALAITNFINLFMAQGETRMNEIAIRKTNGASIGDIVRQFFSEVAGIVGIAFVLGAFLAIIVMPRFSKLIHIDIELTQLLNPVFILCLIALFVLTVTLSVAYPSFYLSRFSPLDILGKRLKFSKHRLTAVVVIFQSIITIVLISYILVINQQTTYLENLPMNYNDKNIVSVSLDGNVWKNYTALKQELLHTSGIQNVSGSDHTVGERGSGQTIALLENRENQQSVNEYRMTPGWCELMDFQLVEGEFFKEDRPENTPTIILNEATVKMLGLESPIVGKHVLYKNSDTEIIGVVKDFIYGEPANPIQPLVLSACFNAAKPRIVYIKFDKNSSRADALALVTTVFRKFDAEFVANPVWSEDIYTKKFDGMKTQYKLVFISSLLSVFIAMLGLLAIHLYTAVRRTKEIGIRRINGASPQSIFSLLSLDIIQWIVIAGIIAVPIAYYIASEWLNNYSNHTNLGGWVFILPIIIQCLIAIITTSGVSIHVLSQNPVKSLKSD